MTQNLRQLADQLAKTSELLKQQALAQEHAEIFHKVTAPGGIFHGPHWHKNFKWHVNPPKGRGDLAANGFDQGLYLEQMQVLASHPDVSNWAREHFGCEGVFVASTYLSFRDPYEYVPFLKKHNIELTTTRQEDWEAQLEITKLVCSLFYKESI